MPDAFAGCDDADLSLRTTALQPLLIHHIIDGRLRAESVSARSVGFSRVSTSSTWSARSAVRLAALSSPIESRCATSESSATSESRLASFDGLASDVLDAVLRAGDGRRMRVDTVLRAGEGSRPELLGRPAMLRAGDGGSIRRLPLACDRAGDGGSIRLLLACDRAGDGWLLALRLGIGLTGEACHGRVELAPLTLLAADGVLRLGVLRLSRRMLLVLRPPTLPPPTLRAGEASRMLGRSCRVLALRTLRVPWSKRLGTVTSVWTVLMLRGESMLMFGRESRLRL